MVATLETLVKKARAALTIAGTALAVNGCCATPVGVVDEVDTATYMVTVENEEWKDGNSPTKTLTTNLTLSDEGSQVVWERNEQYSIDAPPTSDEFMEVYSITLPNARIDTNNRARTETSFARNFGVDYSTIDNYHSAIEDLAQVLSADVLRETEGKWGWKVKVQDMHAFDATSQAQQMQMHRWLRGESDPHSVTTIDLIGKEQGNNVYRVRVHHVEEDLTRSLALTATFNYGTGELRRVDGESKLGGSPYSKVYIWLPDPQGFEIKKYGVDNASTAASFVYMPEVIAAHK